MPCGQGWASGLIRGLKGRMWGWDETSRWLGTAMTLSPSDEPREPDPEKLKELASIARLISFARQSAMEINADFPVWCLDLALGAVLQEMYSNGEQPALFDECMGTPPDTEWN